MAGRQQLLFFQKAFESWILGFAARVSGLFRSFFLMRLQSSAENAGRLVFVG